MNAAPTVGVDIDSYEYDAFGNSFTVIGSTPNNYLYRGEQYDPDLGLYYLRARYYNPLSGRFMSRDPEGGKQTEPATLHKYLYAGGNPVNAFDPTGRVSLPVRLQSAALEYSLIVTVVTQRTIPQLYITGRTVGCMLWQAATLIEMAGEGAELIHPPDWVGAGLGAGWDWCETFGY